MWGDFLCELRISVCERRLEKTVLRPALLPVKTAQFIQFFRQVWRHTVKPLFNWECITPCRRISYFLISFIYEDCNWYTAYYWLTHFKLLELPPYSPNLAPSDFYLFPKLFIAGQRFSSNQGAIAIVEGYFADLTNNHYKDGIVALEHRWNKYISVKGDYVEK